MRSKKIASGMLFVAMHAISQPAAAFGIGDLIGAGIQVGAKVGGALIDKAIDATKDQEQERKKKEAEKAKRENEMLSGLQKSLDEIEAKKDWTPYQREKAKLTLIEAMAHGAALAAMVEDLTERQEEAKRAERDRTLTAGGLLGTVADAALNTPSAVMARSNALAKSPEFQREARQMAARGLQSQSPTDKLITAINRANEANIAKAKMKDGLATMEKNAEAELAPSLAKAEVEARDNREKFATLHQTNKSPEVFFSEDMGKTLYVEYVDSPAETQKIQALLTARGHQIANSRASAQVYFRIEGEYMISESGQHKGVMLSAGKGLDLTEPLTPPEKKEQGVIASALGGVLKAMVKDANATTTPQPTAYQQAVLIVASRQVSNEETRHSVINKVKSTELQPKELLAEANQNLYVKLGLLPPPKEESATPAEALEAETPSEK